MTELSLSRLNWSFSSPTIIRFGALFVFVAALFVFVFPSALIGNLGVPPEPGDGPDYDAMALELSKGKGFSFNWDDPEFRTPYEARNNNGAYDYLLDRHGDSPSAVKPPLLPFLMSVSYAIFGRHFGPVRVMNSIFMALAVALVFILIARWFGVIPGLLCVTLLVCVDDRSRFYASLVLTEALACLLVTGMLWALLRTMETRSRKWACYLGLVTAIAFLVRNTFFLWMPVIAVAVFALARPEGSKRRFSFASMHLPSLFVATFLLVAGPWMIRNCAVLRGFEPLGTMSMDLPAAYSDKAVEQNGVWFNLYETRGRKANPGETRFYELLPTEGASLIEQERIRSERGKAEAIEWAWRNPAKLPLLAFLRIRSEWQPHGLRESFLLGFAILGFLVLLMRVPRRAAAIFFILAACTLAIAVTWSVGGRFIVPVLPVLMSLSALGIWSFIVSATELPQLLAEKGSA